MELRLNINNNMSPWLPDHVKKRLRELKPQYISASGWLIVTSQIERTQERNLRDAMLKIQSFVDEACIPVKEREFKEYKEDEIGKAKRVDYKRKKSEIKSRRGS